MNIFWVLVTNRRQASIIRTSIHFNLISYGANKPATREVRSLSSNIFSGENGVRGDGWGEGSLGSWLGKGGLNNDPKFHVCSGSNRFLSREQRLF